MMLYYHIYQKSINMYMKTFEEYSLDNLPEITPEIEKSFLDIVPLNELEIKFDFYLNLRDCVFYFYKDILIFVHDKSHFKMFGIDSIIWNNFRERIKYKQPHDYIDFDDFDVIRYILNKMIEKYLNLENIDVSNGFIHNKKNIERHFKI